MASCLICGNEKSITPLLRLWSPDDGWQIGRLCPYCNAAASIRHRQPQPDDYAYEKRGLYVSDEQDAMDAIYG